MKNTYCSIVTIGDELLIGQTIDTNSAWIAQQLNPLGIIVKRRVAVGDVKEDVLNALHAELNESEIVIITGGLGPTNDDITKDILCEFFNDELVIHEETLEYVRQIFEKRNRPMLQVNLDQALVPSKCEVLPNRVGTAPALLFQPKGKFVVALPGVPFEMQHLVSTQILHRLTNQFKTPNFIHRTLVTSGEGESFIANKLIDFEAALPSSVKLAYLPKLGIVKLRLTGTEVEVELMDTLFEDLKRRLKAITVIDKDKELEGVIASFLTQHKLTLSLAESCTGGALASMFTSISGASRFFKGGLVTYTNESKVSLLGVSTIQNMTETAVSEAVAMEMAQKVCAALKTDYALGIVGYLEKNDHDNEVWVAIHSAKGNFTKHFRVWYDRTKNITLACNTALNFLWQHMKADMDENSGNS